MNKFSKLALIIAALSSTIACTRIESGEVGVRVDMSKQIQGNELQPGTWNQTIIGDVITFQVRGMQVAWNNLTPQTKDNSTLKDFDVAMIYEVNPSAVAELWTKQSRSFHVYDKGDYYLMFNYMTQLLNSASTKAVRKYNALEVADNRQNIENDTRDIVIDMLKSDKLDSSITITQVRVANTTPANDIVNSANAAVKAANDLKTKQVEVEIARQEAERVRLLNANSQAIPYLQATAQMEIAKAVREGKVHTIVIPNDFKGIVNVGK